MSFVDGAENVRVDDGHMLRARLRNSNGDMVDAELDLNTIIGNSNGTFQWGAENFSGSAQNIAFSVEGGANVPVLRANLAGGEDDSAQRDINLAERISNQDGQFVFN